MKKEVMDYVVGKTHELMAAPSCSKEAKDAAQAWLDAVGTEKEAEETKKYIEELEADIMPVDNLIAFAESEMGAKVFGGAEAAACKQGAGQLSRRALQMVLLNNQVFQLLVILAAHMPGKPGDGGLRYSDLRGQLPDGHKQNFFPVALHIVQNAAFGPGEFVRHLGKLQFHWVSFTEA